MTNQPKINRRNFLTTAGAGLLFSSGAYAPFANQLFAAQPQAKNELRFKKAVKINMVKFPTDKGEKGKQPFRLVEKFKLLKRLGYDGVELDSPTKRYDKDSVLKASAEADLPVHGVVNSTHWKKPLSSPDKSVREEAYKDLITAIKDAKAFGGDSVLLVPGRVNKEVTYDQAWSRSQVIIRRALRTASDEGIKILFENVWNDFLTDPAETAKYIDQLGSDVVGAYFDVGNAVRYDKPTEWIRILGKRIVKLDIKEFSLEKAKKRQRDGFGVKLLEGDCNWPSVMDALKKLDYRGWATAEVPGGEEERLREIAERMDKIFAGYQK